MIFKIVTLFLVFMAVLAMYGLFRLRLKMPGGKKLVAGKCRRCGRYRIGTGPCPCGEGDSRR